MKFKELKALNEQDMQNKLQELYTTLMKDNAQVASGTTPKNPGQLKQTKKTIARINTLLKQREQGGAKQA
ncbi:50S ribosomal protein L29 [Candidatus Woesearchaeota archaeon]|nr:50S ribosomal protein L29 [Candidatus Woesearchaeota archaeon]